MRYFTHSVKMKRNGQLSPYSRSTDYNWSYILYFIVSFVTRDVLSLSFPTGEFLSDGPT